MWKVQILWFNVGLIVKFHIGIYNYNDHVNNIQQLCHHLHQIINKKYAVYTASRNQSPLNVIYSPWS